MEIIIACMVLDILLFMFYKFFKFKKSLIKEILKYVIISLTIGCFLEIFIFNFRHFESLFFKNEQQVSFTVGNGIQYDSDKDMYKIVDPSKACIEIDNLNTQVDNLYLDLSSNKNLMFDYDIYLSDDANSLYFKANNKTYVEKIKNSHFIKINASEKTHKISLLLNNGNNKDKPKVSRDYFKINDIKINVKVPFFISLKRFALVCSFAFFICCTVSSKKSELRRIKFYSKFSKVVIILAIIAFSFVFYKLITLNKYQASRTKMTLSESQYKNLAEALYEGHFDLNLKASDKLLAIDNPYDTGYRYENLDKHSDYYWDYAYYNGKYYSYFGVVPCLLLYLPYYAISSSHLSNSVALTISAIFFVICTFRFIYVLCKKYFKETSMTTFMFLAIFFIFACGVVSYVTNAAFYGIPILLGLAFSLLGLSFYISASLDDSLGRGKRLFFGSLCLALVAGCRPQLLMGYLLAIPLFWKPIFKDRTLFSKKSIKQTVCLILPFIVVASLLMYYNYARFWSPFDFGANYNLTTNDMTKRGLKFDRIFSGLYAYLFEPARVSTKFPFIETYSVNTSYIGKTISEKMYGGFFFCNIICLLGLFSFKLKDKIKNKELFTISILSIISAIIIVLADTQLAGILSRYFLDFGWLIAISTIIVILSLLEKYKDCKELRNIIYILVIISIVYNLFACFVSRDLWVNNLYTFNRFRYMFMFWL